MGHKLKSNKVISSKIDFFYYAFRNTLLVSLTLLFIVTFILSLPYSHASINSSADNVSINIPVACTMIGNVTAAHTASMVGGTQTELDSNGIGIGTTEIDTVCNDKNGYLVYALGTTQNSNGEVVLSANIGSDYDIKTGTGRASSSNNVSSWGMKLLPVSGNNQYPPDIVQAYTDFTSIPSTWTKVASRASATSSSSHSQFITTYSVYTTPGQPAGTYSGEVKYVMLHPSTTTVVPTNTLESAFAAAGKQKKQNVVDPVTGQTGNFYKMQDMENSICQAVIPNSNPGYDEIQLVDDRDNKIYWVAKLKDGNCWMTQNLDLDLSSDMTLTSNDTDLNDNSLSGAYSLHYSYNPDTKVISWTPENTTRNYSASTGTGWTNDDNKAYSLDPGAWYWDGNDNTQNCNYLTTTCEDFSQTPYSNNGTHNAVGNYYNWPAAIASDDSSSLTANTYIDINLNPQNSICPKGWRLPTISNQSDMSTKSTSEFFTLNNLYNEARTETDAGLIIGPLWCVRAGFIYNGNPNYAGFYGDYWSSTINNANNKYFLRISNDRVNVAQTEYNVHRGNSIRCVAR